MRRGNPELEIGNKDSVLLVVDLISASKVLDGPQGAEQKAESYKDDRQRERPPLEDPRQQGGQQGADADDGEQQVRKVHLPGMATVALVNRFRGPGRRAGAAIPTSAQFLRSHGTTGPVAWDHRA